MIPSDFLNIFFPASSYVLSLTAFNCVILLECFYPSQSKGENIVLSLYLVRGFTSYVLFSFRSQLHSHHLSSAKRENKCEDRTESMHSQLLLLLSSRAFPFGKTSFLLSYANEIEFKEEEDEVSNISCSVWKVIKIFLFQLVDEK